MDDERRYGEDEVRTILENASERSRRSLSSSDGLTLAELQSIGTEVGLSPQEIAEAARALDAPSPAPPRRSLGMPVAADRTARLSRAPTDAEWERLVVELRATFGAHGKEASRGNLREWRNGNLFAYVEPMDEGYRLRLGTVKGSAALVNGFGIVATLGGLITLANLVATNDLAGVNGFLPMIWGSIGAGAFGYNAVRLPRWARRREMQMDHIVDRARALLHDGRSADAPPADGAP
jgi:hypothetical protein